MNLKKNARFFSLAILLFTAPVVMGASDLSGGGCRGRVDSDGSFSVGGSASGLSGTLVLQNNGGDNLTLTSEGDFTFATPLVDGSTYNVTVLTQPASQTCSVSSGSGTVEGADVTDVNVTCSANAYTVGGNVSGLSGTLVLQNNGADDQTLSSDGSFTFPTPVAQGSPYSVTILSDPMLQTCVVVNGSGTMGEAQVTNVSVLCAPNAYVTPALSATSIDLFSLDPSTGLLNSSPATAYSAGGLENFGQMTFATVDGVRYAYLTNPNGAVYQCTLAADGTFSACAATSSLPPLNTWQARAIAFATFDAQYAYLVDPGNNYIYQCGLAVSGDFANCQFLSPPTLAPYGIAFASDANGETHSYIADADNGSGAGAVTVCSMQNNGSLNACAPSPASGAPDWIPYAVAFTTVNGVQYAYVADNGTGTPGHVYRCSLNTNGTFEDSSCVQTPDNDITLTDWYPYYIDFKTVGSTQYAYVVNNSGSSIGNIYRCEMDSDGLLTDCVMTPDATPMSWQPSGIAF